MKYQVLYKDDSTLNAIPHPRCFTDDLNTAYREVNDAQRYSIFLSYWVEEVIIPSHRIRDADIRDATLDDAYIHYENCYFDSCKVISGSYKNCYFANSTISSNASYAIIIGCIWKDGINVKD